MTPLEKSYLVRVTFEAREIGKGNQSFSSACFNPDIMAAAKILGRNPANDIAAALK
jgi:hypothetical protein